MYLETYFLTVYLSTAKKQRTIDTRETYKQRYKAWTEGGLALGWGGWGGGGRKLARPTMAGHGRRTRAVTHAEGARTPRRVPPSHPDLSTVARYAVVNAYADQHPAATTM